MVDLISTRTMDLTKLAMDGLMERQKAITANTANVMTPGYQRKEITFENQLREMVAKDDLKTYIKEQNSIEYNPTSLDVIMGNTTKPSITAQQAKYLQSDIYGNFSPQVMDDTASGSDETGNNVQLEKEVMDMAKVGNQYNVLARLEAKSVKIIAGAIKGDVQ